MPKVRIEKLLSGIVQPDKSLSFEHAVLLIARIDSRFVADEDLWFLKSIEMCIKDKTPLDLDVFSNFIQEKGLSEDNRLILMRRFSEATQDSISHEKFLVLLGHAEYEIKRQFLQEQMRNALQALEGSYFDTVQKIRYDGVDGAHEILSSAISDNLAVSQERFLSGNVFSDVERDRILSDFQKSKDGKFKGIPSGFSFIDSVTFGFSPGDFVVVGASTSEGKSMMCVNFAWHMSVVEAKNVVVITAEMLRESYIRRLLARHSCKDEFGGPTEGLQIAEIKQGLLSGEKLKKFNLVVDDFTRNPNFGYLNVMQVTQGATLHEVRKELQAISSQTKIDVLIIDYLSLLSSSRHRAKIQEEKIELLQQAKELAVTFDSGRGLVVISAHQMSSEARNRAKPDSNNFYRISDFADTSEVGKSVDIALALLRTDDLIAKHQVCVGFLKLRDGEIGGLVHLYENYNSSYLGEVRGKDII